MRQDPVLRKVKLVGELWEHWAEPGVLAIGLLMHMPDVEAGDEALILFNTFDSRVVFKTPPRKAGYSIPSPSTGEDRPPCTGSLHHRRMAGTGTGTGTGPRRDTPYRSPLFTGVRVGTSRPIDT